ncbi:MAG: sarcosine oxidase subunit gamma [Pararhodobacter sp.]
MSEPVSALNGARSGGMVELAEAGLHGMITLRGDLSDPRLAAALDAALGCPVPVQRRLATGRQGSALWMSPDELLLITDYAQAGARLKALEAALAEGFFTLADVSDARAVFTLEGAQARDVLAKICPVDFADFALGEVRRTRAAQIAAALWRSGEDEFTLVCFRSVAQYMWDLLGTVARPGGEVGLYR